MDEQISEILSEVKTLSDRVSRIETHLEYQKEHQARVERTLLVLEETKASVHRHETIIKGFSWLIGIVVSFFTAKFFGRF